MAGSAVQAPEASAALARRLDRITQSVALAGFFGLVCIAFLTFYDGAARYLGIPRLSGFSDYGELVYPIVISSCFSAGLLRQSNITVRVIGELAGPRVTAVLEAIAGLIVLAFFAVLVWQFVELTGKYADAGRTTRTISLPLAPAWVITTIIMALCIPVQVYVTYAWMRTVVTGHPPPHMQLKKSSEVA
ncbi:TRAP transporter small permease [Pseudaestuariivita sp.]|uniref:TRAP transporter small permease n=1 Tax=Pseudaestuariivita sp. TaxID=2211669 RepID=UPI004059FB75